MQVYRNWTGVSLLIMTALACGDLEGPSNDNTTPPGSNPGEDIETTEATNGLKTSVVNASDQAAWIYMDLETQSQVTVDDPLTSTDWDIAFQRFKVKINGGIHGNAGVEVAVMEGVSFIALTEAPSDGYVVDAEDGDDTGEILDYAISVTRDSESGPWAYNNETHSLSQSEFVFVVKTVEDNYFKLEFQEYYSELGESGHVTFRWGQLDGRLAPDTYKISATADWQYIDVASGEVLTSSTATTTTDWDIAVRTFAWRTNSGEGVAGQGGSQLAPEGSEWDGITEAPTEGYDLDADMVDPGPAGGMTVASEHLSGWFDYDFNTHEIWTKEAWIVFVRSGDGSRYAKVQITDYNVSTKTYTIRMQELPAAQ